MLITLLGMTFINNLLMALTSLRDPGFLPRNLSLIEKEDIDKKGIAVNRQKQDIVPYMFHRNYFIVSGLGTHLV